MAPGSPGAISHFSAEFTIDSDVTLGTKDRRRFAH